MGSMGGEGAQLDPVDCDSLLPPRKRLLACLRRQNSDCSALASVNSDELRARLQGLLNSTDLSPEEIVEAAKSEALAATKAAADARAVAAEKAIVAANARALAKSLLELVTVSAEGDENPMKSHPKKKRTKKDLVSVEKGEDTKNHHPKKKKAQKHVPVELLYRSGGPVPTSETDEELARRLHRAMNSSPRISTRLNKSDAVRATGNSDGGAVCVGNPTSPDDGSVASGEGNYVEKSEGRIAMGSRVDCPEKVVGAGDPFESPKSVWKGVAHGRRGSRRQKKLPLSQCCLRAQENAREIAMLEDHPPIGEPKCDATGDLHAPPKGAPNEEEHAALEAKPVWKCKKFRVSRCHSAGKNLHRLCSIPAVDTASALVKVD